MATKGSYASSRGYLKCRQDSCGLWDKVHNWKVVSSILWCIISVVAVPVWLGQFHCAGSTNQKTLKQECFYILHSVG